MDLFADALCKFYETGRATLHVERDDGYKDTEDLSWYLATYRSFPSFEKQALKFARGCVLDIGSGAGRHALYLQRRGLRVTGIDTSPQLVGLAQLRGVKDVRLGNACGKLPFRDREFDTVLLFGNNLGICGTVARFKGMLRELHRITCARGRILATTRMPNTTSPKHRAYVQRNIARGRPGGQVTLRLMFAGKRSAWFDLLLLTPADLMEMAAKEGWLVSHLFVETDLEDAYSAVLEKK
jgi:SAM-dependent methyltransferase